MSREYSNKWPDYTYIDASNYTHGRVRFTGLGTYIPSSIITNEFFAYVATRLGSPRGAEDIERVTGLQTRHVCASTLDLCRRVAGSDAPGLIAGQQLEEHAITGTSDAIDTDIVVDMAVIAARRALESAGRQPEEVDAIVAASSSDNYLFPTLAGLIQHRLGCRRIRAITLKGACASDTEAFQSAMEMLLSSNARRVLVVASEAFISNITHILDWKTSSLFGEGAAAFLLERGESAEDEAYAISGYDASQAAALYCQTPLRRDAALMAETDRQIAQFYQEGRAEEANALLSQHLVGYTRMNGKEVYREAPRAMAECVDALCRHAGFDARMISWIIPHQPNSRIIARIGHILMHDYGWPEDTGAKMVNHFFHYGNLSNASIGMAIVEELRLGHLQPGQCIVLPAAGGGMHYGGWLLRYQGFHNPEATIAPYVH